MWNIRKMSDKFTTSNNSIIFGDGVPWGELGKKPLEDCMQNKRAYLTSAFLNRPS